VDHQVIGMDHALGKELPLDETEQVCHGRRTLDDHRARLVRGVGEDDVDAVETGEHRVLRQGVQAPCGDILDDVGEETRHRWLGKLLGHPPGLALARLSGNLPPSGLKGVTRSLKARDLDRRLVPEKRIH
jgi:hypothetical protein